MRADEHELSGEGLMQAVRSRHPRLLEALVADAKVAAAYRGERSEFRSLTDALVTIVRLAWSSDAFFAQGLYRAKARLQALGVPLLPRVCHRLAMVFGQVQIGDPVVIAPGLYLLHGQVVIDGFTEIGAGAAIAPFVTIGLRQGEINGPTIGDGVQIGTGAKVLGGITVGDGATVGANAVVIHDVPPGETATGVPAPGW
jgi:serine O-acetyltransferase